VAKEEDHSLQTARTSEEDQREVEESDKRAQECFVQQTSCCNGFVRNKKRRKNLDERMFLLTQINWNQSCYSFEKNQNGKVFAAFAV
jgi:hypothetical protein